MTARIAANAATEVNDQTSPRVTPQLREAGSPVRVPRRSALEADFPAAFISRLAEHESWRKEVHRPATHTHKWWAQRLGSVFRGILVAATSSTAAEAELAYASPTRLPGIIVYDPFAGSGTTVVEAVKLGARVAARDINPVAVLVQRQALQHWEKVSLEQAMHDVEAAVRDRIDALYVTSTGQTVLYYFWVTVARCPKCSVDVDLFSSRVFAKHAYPRRNRRAQAVCAACSAIVEVDALDTDPFLCPNGHVTPRDGAVSGQYMTCSSGHQSRVVDSVGAIPLQRRLYAKLVINEASERAYLPADDFDRKLFQHAEQLLERESHKLVLPSTALADGYNTRQAIRWGFREWRQFFNARQLYALGLLGAAIRDLDTDAATREAMATLFSGCLEFNNLFCSYKGEGTGAVRHMFSNHILKPERTPLEAHPWGTPKSSGSFSTLFRTRLLRALDYKREPHDAVLIGDRPERITGLSEQLSRSTVDTWQEFRSDQDSAYIVAGDSRNTDIPDQSVDLIVTDPPFVDNVHYSELADFFHAWLREIQPYSAYPSGLDSTRQKGEVQNTSTDDFEDAIAGVWKDAARILKDDGLLALTFHHSTATGWIALMRALRAAGLVVTAVQPVKAELSVSTPKAAAAAPSNLDSIVVCRKGADDARLDASPRQLADQAEQRLIKLRAAGVRVGRTDIQSVVRGSVMALMTRADGRASDRSVVEQAEYQADRIVDQLDLR